MPAPVPAGWACRCWWCWRARRWLATDTGAVLAGLKAVATRSVWLGPADIGGSPMLPAPLSWCMRWQTGRVVQLLRTQARAQGVPYLDFFAPPANDPHARLAGTCFADDGLHPSAAGYRHCFESLKRQVVLPGAQALRRTPAPENCHAQRV